MLKYINDFVEKYEFPLEAIQAVNESYDKLKKSPELESEFKDIIARYTKDINADYNKILEDSRECLQKADIPLRMSDLIVCICLTKQLKEYYIKANIDLNLYDNLVKDILYKAHESKLNFGVWGIDVGWWFGRHFAMQLFAFEKLQFELKEFDKHFEGNGYVLNPGDLVINIHLPRTGGKLDREGQLKAYAQASEFFADKLNGQKAVFRCHSWFLWPRLKEVIKPESNIGAFASDFEIVESGDFENYERWSWRLYDTRETDLDKLPQNTTLQRWFVQLFKQGVYGGFSEGVFLYDNVKNKKC